MPNIKLTIQDKADIVRLAATSSLTNKEIAERFKVTPTRIGQVVKLAKDEIDEAKHNAILRAIESASGNSIVDQQWRLKEYERDLYKLDHLYSPDAVNARGRILSQVAKELGQVAPIQQNITGTVSHIIGIDQARALPPMHAEVMAIESPVDG